MWREHFINANPATIMQRLYQIKAQQDGKKVTIIAHARKRDAGEKSVQENSLPLAASV